MRLALLAAAVLALAPPALAQVSGDFGGVNGGAVRVGASTSTCDATTEGAIKYVDASNRVELCDDSTWIAVGSGSSGPLEVTGGAGSEVVRNLDSVAPYATADFVFGSSQLADTGNAAHDARMFFDKSKGAFRAGMVDNTNWDNANVGNYSVALGFDTTASASSSFAVVDNATATGVKSVAMGSYALATEQHSFAIGPATKR